jgi:sulfur-oxidizing protein SoxY
MRSPRARIVVRRREVLAAAASLLALAALPRHTGAGGAEGRSTEFDAALKEILAGRTPEEGAISLILPEHAENGNIVPYEIAVESPMTAAEFVSQIYLLSTSNPHAKVAKFFFSPRSGRASVKGRMRLARTQDVVAVAEMNSGKVHMMAARVEVAIGGCQT